MIINIFNKKYLKFIFIILMIIFIQNIFIISSNAFIGNNIKIDNISLTNGQKSLTKPVINIFQDNNDLMWFATSDGLVRFDGTKQKFYSIKKLFNNQKAIIRTVDIDQDGHIWIGTEEGFLYKFDVDDESIQKLEFKNINKESIVSIYCENKNNIWFSTKSILYMLDKMTLKTSSLNILNDENIEHSSGDTIGEMIEGVRKIKGDEKGNILLGTDKGVLYFNSTESSITSYINSINSPKTMVNEIFLDTDGMVLIGSEEGLFPLDMNSERFTFFSSNSIGIKSLLKSTITSITHDIDKNLYIGTDGNGLYKIEKETGNIQIYNSDYSTISNNKINSLFTDNKHNIWIGLDGEVNLISKSNNLFNHTRKNGNNNTSLNNDKVSAILEDSKGNLWIGTSFGVEKYQKSTGTYIQYKNLENDSRSISNNTITSIVEDRDGDIWIGTKNGLNKYNENDESFENYYADNKENSITSNFITTIMAHGDKLYIGTNLGLNILDLDTNNLLKYNTKGFDNRSLSSLNIRVLLHDNEKNLWIGTDNGLNKLDLNKNEFRRYQNESDNINSLSFDEVNSIYKDYNGKDKFLWIGTGAGSLDKFDTKTEEFTRLKHELKLDVDVIYGILGYLNDIFLSTNRGLFKLNIKDMKLNWYTRENGIQRNEFNQNAYFKSKSNEFFFGGDNGFNSFYPWNIEVDNTPSKIFISSIKKSGIEIPMNKNIELSYNDKTLSFEFSLLDYTNKEANEYAYMLEGIDSDWEYSGNRNYASYSNLDPGKYGFKVKGVNTNGIWSIEPLEININVKANPFKTRWAYTIYGIIIFGILFIYIRINFNIKEREIQRQKVLVQNLKKVDKMKDDFLANTSHELRTPLNGIIGISESLIEGTFGEMQPTARNNMNLILSSGKRLLRLVNDILDLSKINRGEFNVSCSFINFYDTYNDCIGMIKSIADKKGLEFIDKVNQEEILVYVDGYRLQQILFNLIGNAIKFTEVGSVEVGTNLKEKYLEIYIKDTGMGISHNKQKNIFEEFYQVDSSTIRDSNGTGLGLAITKKLVKMLGGDLWVESEEEKGSIFTFTIPLVDELEAQTIENNIYEQESFNQYVTNDIDIKDVLLKENTQEWDEDMKLVIKGDNYKVLIVDDEMINRVDLANRLVSLGNFTVLTADNGQDAIDIINSNTDIDLILMDVMMPKMSGYEASIIIRKSYNQYEMPILMLTAKDQIKDIIEAFNSGANDYLTKPYDKEVLKSRAKNLIELKHAVRNALQRTDDLKIEKNKRELSEMFAHVSGKVSQSLNIKDIMNVFIESIEKHLKFKRIYMTIICDDINLATNEPSNNFSKLYEHYLESTDNYNINTIVEKLKNEGFIKNPKSKSKINVEEDIFWYDYPIYHNDKFMGMLSISVDSEEIVHLNNEEIIRTLINQTATSIENARLYSKVRELATIDDLTRLFNRRQFFELATESFNNCLNNNKDFTIIMMDIDNFKSFNDNYGHAIGDEVLKKVANVIKNNSKETAISARFGGEEFIVEVEDFNEAIKIAERIRKEVEEIEININETEIRITLSLGVSKRKLSETELFETIKRADEGLYKAKECGKNRVIINNEEKFTDIYHRNISNS